MEYRTPLSTLSRRRAAKRSKPQTGPKPTATVCSASREPSRAGPRENTNYVSILVDCYRTRCHLRSRSVCLREKLKKTKPQKAQRAQKRGFSFVPFVLFVALSSSIS